jgi:glutamyl-tRNA synthetase
VTVRVRFAPSPTGYLHVGGARTALYNWLFARSRNGTFILRSDDTDQERSSREFAEDIIGGLRWLGLGWDEGIEAGGPHGSYRQSDRFGRYRQVAEQLVASGHAYHSFVTAEQLDQLKDEARAASVSPAYDGRYEPAPEEAEERAGAGEAAPIRFRVPRPGQTVFSDAVRGEIVFGHDQVEDFVILRSDESPTYQLASTVDDVDYTVSHVIRGEDILSSTPKHIMIAEAMGGARPVYAHLSLLTGPDGKKLSKRHGHTAIAAYRDQGYLPEAMVNYLALLGWSPGDDETIVPLRDMVDRFDLPQVSRNPAIFDPDKLQWMSGVYLRGLSAEDFVARSLPLVEANLDRRLTEAEVARFHAIAPHVQERAKLLTEVAIQVRFLFLTEVEHDEASWKAVMGGEEAAAAVAGALDALERLEPWTRDAIEEALRAMLAERGLSVRKGLQPIRVAVSGSTVSPPLFESLELLGRAEVIARLVRAQEMLPADG